MIWRPRTLFGQIALASFAVLLLVQLAGLWLLLEDRGRLNYKLLAEYAAQRMAGYATVIDRAAPAERPGLVRALSVLPTTLSLEIPWQSGNIDRSADALAFAAAAEAQLARPLAIQMLAIERIDPVLLELHQRASDSRSRRDHGDGDEDDEYKKSRRAHLLGEPVHARTYVAQVRLGDGTVLSFHHLLPRPSSDLPYRLIALLGLLGLSTAVLSVWAVRRLTRPLVQFANAAEGLAKNLNQPPMAESGPLEVRRAVRAFNTMQASLSRMIATRAQALSAVSHDLRLPITRLRLRLEADVPEAARERMKRDLDEMDGMIGHTLDYLRAGSDTEPLRPLNLDALLDGVIDDMEELGARVERSGQCIGPLPARPHALRRCIGNLLDNARFYGGGMIWVRVEDRASELVIHIADDGPGIPPGELEKVFEPYFRVEASRARHTGGTGLGLPIARAIAESHGGTLTLSSAAGAGLTATLCLPRRGS